MNELCKNRSLLLLTVGFSTFIGLYFSLGNICSALFSPFNTTPFEVAVIGLIMLGSGIFGAALTGMILDKTAAYKRLLIVLSVITIISTSLFSYSLMTFASNAMIRFFVFWQGISMVSVLPAALGLGIELTFPLAPPLVNGMMMMFAQINSFVQSFTYSAIMDIDPADFDSAEELLAERQIRSKYCLIPILFVLLVAFVCFIFVQEDLKRTRYAHDNSFVKEKEDAEELISQSKIDDDDYKHAVN